MKTVATAPSKLLLSGEYAVLDGAPAVVAAVDRRVCATVEDASGDGWTVTSDLDGATHALAMDDHRSPRLPDGRDAREEPATRLAAAALAQAARRGSLPPLKLTLESGALRTADGAKLGLGSSAALAVALAAALARHLSGGGALRLEDALRLHRELQDGRGSGADVAASFCGGTIRFQRTNAGGADVRPVTLPRDLRWAAVWTGTSSSTGAYLRALEAARQERPKALEGVLARLRERAEEAAEALAGEALDRALAALDAYREGMERLGEAIGMAVLTPPHRTLAGLATAEGAVYKPSGAGGGDVGVIFGGPDTRLERMLEAARAAGYAPLAVKVDPRGVSLDTEGTRGR